MHHSRNELLTAHYLSLARTLKRAHCDKSHSIRFSLSCSNLFINKQTPLRSKVPFGVVALFGFCWMIESDWIAQGRTVLRVNKL